MGSDTNLILKRFVAVGFTMFLLAGVVTWTVLNVAPKRGGVDLLQSVMYGYAQVPRNPYLAQYLSAYPPPAPYPAQASYPAQQPPYPYPGQQPYPPQYPPQYPAQQYPGAAQYPAQQPYPYQPAGPAAYPAAYPPTKGSSRQAYVPPPPPPPPPPCDTSCVDTFYATKDQISEIKDSVEHSHALCYAINQLFNCECDSCQSQDPALPGVSLQEELCTPAQQVVLVTAGGPCAGFAHFCSEQFQPGGAYCTNKAFEPPSGSPEWLAYHQVEDPGNASAVAGKNLAQAQLPNYMQSAITSMVNYFSVGTTAESKGAELANNVAEQIEAFGPDDGHRDELQHDVFGEHVTVAEAKKYAANLRKFEATLKSDGVDLPEATAKEFQELEDAAERYNAAPRAVPAVCHQMSAPALFMGVITALATSVAAAAAFLALL